MFVTLVFAYPLLPQAQDLELVRSYEVVTDPVDVAPGEISRHRVAVNVEPLLTGAVAANDRIRITLPAGELTVDVTRVQSFTDGTISVAGMAAGSEDALSLTFADDGAAGVATLDGRLYHLQWRNGDPVLLEMDPGEVDELECAVSESERAVGSTPFSHAAMRQAVAPLSAMNPRGNEYSRTTIDVVLAYTPNAASWAAGAHGSIETVIAQMMNNSHLALDNSETYVDVRVVHHYQTDYDENIPPMPGYAASSSHLRRFTAGPDFNPWGPDAQGYMEEVHELRDEYGADLGSLLAHVSGFGGIAWVLSNLHGSQERGFSVNRVQQMTTGYTFIHEVGHNMGLRHHRTQPSAAAPAYGGILAYSVGWRFDAPQDPTNDSYATVMTYTMSGSPRAPHFSNPDVSFQGVPTGAYEGEGAPADAARSMREAKRIIASYRPTNFEPPVPIVTPASLEIALEAGESTSVMMEIANTGESDLMWDVELQPAAPAASRLDRGGAPILSDAHDSGVEAEAPLLIAGIAQRDAELIYETTFSMNDGYELGSHAHVAEWTTRSDDAPIEILAENPSAGDQHLRIAVPTDFTGSHAVHSPALGLWPTGGYELSLDFSLNQQDGPPYVIVAGDGRTGAVTAAVLLLGTGAMAVFDGMISHGELDYLPVAHTWQPDTYHTLAIVIDPAEGEVSYVVDDAVIASQPFFDGISVGQVQIHRSSGAPSVHMDLDNVSLAQQYAGLGWLDVDTPFATTGPGDASQVKVHLDAAHLAPGSHNASILVNTNVEDGQIEVPIQVSVGPVGSEGEPVATSDRLLGNHPNPARGETTIAYELSRGGHVLLEVFTVTGRRVALLVDDYRPGGSHEEILASQHLASGVYLYRLTTDSTVDSGRMVIAR